MKNINKIIMILLVLCMLFIGTDVYAGTYNIKELIPVSDEAEVFSNTFNYSGVKFENGSDGNVNGILRFTSITNNTSSRKSPSFNILLFDGSKKNIGYITYCAEKDYGSDNTMFYIPGNESKPFQINVTSRYFGGTEKDYKGPIHENGEIVYYSFFSDNSYCQIGGYTKYIGLTLEEITGGEVNVDNEAIDSKLKLNELILYLPYLLIGIVALVGYGFLLNCLYKRMHARTSILSYLPMTNLYIAVKLAFGKKVAWVFYILCIVSLFIVYSASNMVFTYVLLGVVGIATLLDIFKLITGNYDMFVIGKKHKRKKGNSLEDTYATNSGSRFIDGGSDASGNNQTPVTANDFLNSINNGVNDNHVSETSLINSNDVVDISYDSDVPITEDNGFILNDNMSSSNNMVNMNQMNSTNNMDIMNQMNSTNNMDIMNQMNSTNNMVNMNQMNSTNNMDIMNQMNNTNNMVNMNPMVNTNNMNNSEDDLLNETISFSNANSIAPVSNLAASSNVEETNNINSIPRLDDDNSGESELSNFFR